MKKIQFKQFCIATLTSVLMFVAVSLSAQDYTITEKVAEYNPLIITVVNPEIKLRDIKIRKLEGKYILVEKLKYYRLQDEDGKQLYMFIGPPGQYYIEVEGDVADGSRDEDFVATITDAANPDDPVDPVDPIDPDDPVDPVDPVVPDDEFDNLGKRIRAAAPSVSGIGYAAEWDDLADKIRDRKILQMSAAKMAATALMARYETFGWSDVNKIITDDANTRTLSLEEAEKYYRAIASGIRGL